MVDVVERAVWCDLCRTRPAAGEYAPPTYTDSDRWTVPNGTQVCAWCLWAHGEGKGHPFRVHPHLVSVDDREAVRLDTGPVLLDAIRRLDGAHAVTVPISQRKHVVPFARPGMVCVDDAIAWSWDGLDEATVVAVAALREWGFPGGSLVEAEPRPQIILARKLDYQQVRRFWRALDPAREHGARLAVAVRITHPPKSTDVQETPE